jgi:hypothetical protein
MDNLRLADKKARKGKSWQPGVIQFSKDSEANLFLLHESLLNRNYRTSDYTIFKVYEPKEREVHRLPYFPDRITHHAIMNVMEPIFISTFTADTYSCIKGKGIHGASYAMRDALKDKPASKYCLKLDVRKFYPTIDHTILKSLLRRKIKDNDLLWLMDEIIDSATGLPIGNYLSQYFANFYLTYFDHWLKEDLKVQYYYRYCDDLVFLAPNKPYLHELCDKVIKYLSDRLKLSVKPNYSVFPSSLGINFVGYVHYPGYTLLRPSIKRSMARAVSARRHKSISAYYGWAKHCNSKNLLKKLSMTKFSELGIKPVRNSLEGNRIDFMDILNKEIKIHRFKIGPSKFQQKGDRLDLQIEVDGQTRVTWCSSGVLMKTIQQVPEDKFPITTTIIKQDKAFIFT